MDSSSLDRPLSSGEETQLAEALELRRKQIDREIAEFKVEKEKEYRKFEKRLRSEKRDVERQKILQCEREVEKAKIKRRGSKDRRSSQPNSGLYDRESAEVVVEDTRSNGVRFAGGTEIAQESDKVRKSDKSKDGRSNDQVSSHEREVEFQGLFTPTYLPLISGRHEDTVGESASEDAVTEEAVREPAPTLTPNAVKPIKANVAKPAPKPTEKLKVTLPTTSEQLTTVPITTSGIAAPISGSRPLTPADPRHLSSSDPRNKSLSERRSSSRSDTSTSSLRSSLRDPKQPRSPKRVLLSINNVVVAPSTSPAMQRKINATKKSDSIDVVSKLDASATALGEGDARFDPYAWRRDVASQSNKSALTNIPSTNSHRINSGSKPPVHPAARIGDGNTSPLMGGDGFEHVRSDEEDDDLFAFDEDIRYRSRDPRNDDDGDAEEEIQDEEVKNRNEVLPTSSPHAGSLPIEIRWPARKDPRKDPRG